MSQDDFTLRIPVKLAADTKVLADQRPPSMTSLALAQEAIATMRSTRFVIVYSFRIGARRAVVSIEPNPEIELTV